MGIHRNAVSLRLLENLDKTKEASVFKHRTEEYKKRRLVLRGRRKKKDDKAEEKEGPSCQSGAFEELEPKSSSKSSSPPSTRYMNVLPAKIRQVCSKLSSNCCCPTVDICHTKSML